MSSSNYCFLTSIQIFQEASKVVWYSHLLKNFPQFVVSHTVKGFSIVSEAKVDVFLVFSLIWFCFLYDPAYIGNLISGSSSFSKSSLYVCKFLVHVLLKPSLKDFEHNLNGMWNVCNCIVIWTFLALPFLRLEWKLIFSSPEATAEFSKFPGILSAALSQHHLSGFETAQLEFHHLH